MAITRVGKKRKYRLTVIASVRISDISEWRKKTLPRHARHKSRSNAGSRSRWITPAIKLKNFRFKICKLVYKSFLQWKTIVMKNDQSFNELIYVSSEWEFNGSFLLSKGSPVLVLEMPHFESHYLCIKKFQNSQVIWYNHTSLTLKMV